MTTFLLTCGETSGEHHASRLARELKSLEPGCRVLALGGDELEAAGAEVLFPLERYALMGFAEVVANLRRFIALERSLQRMLDRGVDCFIPVDYPGLNLRLARHARRRGVPVFYFIGPQVWAWGGWRIGGMRRAIDLMGVILPFERELYREAGIPVVFAGHPMLDEIPAPERPKEAPKPGEPFTVLLFPGSRAQEYERMCPVLLGAARIIKERFPEARFKLGRAPLIPPGAAAVPEDMRGWLEVTQDGIAELGGASLVLAVSGTITLQTAISGTPMVVSYRTSRVTYLIGRLLVKIPWIAMPNVLARRRVVPELIQSQATPRGIADEAARILGDAARYRAMSEELLAVRRTLAGTGGIRRLAEAALRLARGERGADIERSSEGPPP